VVDAKELGALGDVSGALSSLAGLWASVTSPDARTPLSLRLHLPSPTESVETAETEIRFKLRLPRNAPEAGADAVAGLAADTVRRFNLLMEADALRPFLTG